MNTKNKQFKTRPSVTLATTALLFIVMVGFNLQAAKLNFDANKSTLKWSGKKIGTTHTGFVDLESAFLTVNNNKVTGGELVVDMTTIVNTDVESPKYNKKLVDHLKSDDFFGVSDHPVAKVAITKGAKFSDGKATVTGDLMIKGKTEPITFVVMKKGKNYTAKLEIDRSKYDVRYGSKSFFNDLGDKVIDDMFTIDLKLVVK